MTTNIKTTQRLTQEDISSLNIKDLNKKLKQKQISKCEQQDIKKQRRNIKMKKYRKNSRFRKMKEYYTLLEERARLWTELFCFNQEVTQLKSLKSSIIAKGLDISEGDGQNDELVIVD